MSSRKRPASEPLSPSRSPKQPRLSLEIIDSNRPKPRKIVGRWYAMAKDFGELIRDTIAAITTMTILSSPEPSTPSLVDETNTSSSPTSSSFVATPRQTPTAQRAPDVNYTSTSRQDSGLLIQSTPIRGTEVRTWTPQDPILDEDTFPIFQNAKFSTPNVQPGRSSSSDQWTTLKDPSPKNIYKNDVTSGMGTLQLQDPCDPPIRGSEQSNSSSFPSDPKLGTQNSNKLAKRGHQRPIKRREHIYAKVHKAYVLRDRLELREELTQKLYQRKREQGYGSTLLDFKGWLHYKKALQDLTVSPSPSSPSVSFEPRSGARKDETHEEFLQRALDKYDATMKGPKPPVPNVPAMDEINKRKQARQEAINRLLRPPPLPSSLSPDEEKQVSALLHQRGVISKFAREQVSDQDISRLRPGQWLNDEIINFYGAMILARSEGSKENPASLGKGKAKMKTPLNVHYFSSFFWTKLTQEGYDKGRLAKWTKKIDIFSKDAIIMPVNHGNAHWTAAVINFRQKRFESYDSMNMAKSKVFQVLRSYVNAEHMNKKNKPFNFDGWEDWAPATTPQQENGYDCGVFTCQFLETVSRGEDCFNFSQGDMHYLRKRMIWEIGNAKLYYSR